MKATGRALLGVALVALAAHGWLRWWLRQPGFGEYDWPVWGVVVLGVLIAGRGALRPPSGAARADRFVAVLCFALAVGAAGLFAQLSNRSNFALPPVDPTRLAPGRPLPEVELAGADGAPFSLAAEHRAGNSAGRTLLLLFFRGTW
jgi:hypothetical protein